MTRARMAWIVVLGLVVALLTAASAAVVQSGPAVMLTTLVAGVSVIGGTEPAAVLLSRQLFGSSASAIVVGSDADDADWQRATDEAIRRHVPVFGVGADDADTVSAELRRLGVGSLHIVGSVPDDVRAIAPNRDLDSVSGNEPADGPAPLVYVTTTAGRDAVATARAASARVVTLPVADPRATGESVAALKDSDAPVLAVGDQFGDDAEFARRVAAARSVAELPGGGQLIFPMRRMVALYGSPDAPALGPLGRQDIPASIARAKRLAADYQRVSRVPVIPAFEIIATVASASPGEGNTYTNMIDPAVIRPWIAAARAAGVYVTLDLQPGRMDFLTQAKRYTEFLRQPHVGLALDPEWRLKPNQVHLTQIGSVEAPEVNRTSDWLAALVRDNQLPQKLFVLHQFDSDMLANRKQIITSHPELQVLLHADGHGAPPVKMDTWRRLITDLPAGVWMGWKNFYTEDKPTFTPAQTMAVTPTPWFVSYQ